MKTLIEWEPEPPPPPPQPTEWVVVADGKAFKGYTYGKGENANGYLSSAKIYETRAEAEAAIKTFPKKGPGQGGPYVFRVVPKADAPEALGGWDQSVWPTDWLRSLA